MKIPAPSPFDHTFATQEFPTMQAVTDEARNEMEKWRDLNRREARPMHRCTLEEYGFSEAVLKNAFQ